MNNFHENKKRNLWDSPNEDSNTRSFSIHTQRKTTEKANVYMKTKSGSIKFFGVEQKNPAGAYIS